MVFELDALDREAKAEPFEFRFDGEIYTLPPDFDMRHAALFTEGDVLSASPKMLSIGKVNQLLEEWCASIGVELGESAASSRSSRRAAARSKPTSNGSTASRSRTTSRTRRA
jgi:hypothetical protein